MRFTKIAKAAPFEGAPLINLASVFGASPKKPLILRIPVIGERPITYGVRNLPEGLSFSDGIISGQIEAAGSYTVTLTAENALGRCEKELMFEIREDTVLLTPLMGFTSWNAFGESVSQEKMIATAEKMVELGISEYGYSYINTDSGWQGQYGGPFDAVQGNEKFPDMHAMCEKLHSMGFKCGIYSSPMRICWPYRDVNAPFWGCTQGEPDIRFADINTGIGVIRKEGNNARQWEAWGFDYLKYDWLPSDPYNADLMKRELMSLGRDFGFCVTVSALPEYHTYWERYCNSYRCNEDAHGTWDNLLRIYRSYHGFMPYVNRGHYFDLDMLDVGTCECVEGAFALTEDEKIVSYSMRAFLNSPLQISSKLSLADEFEVSLYCNEEVIAIHQDCAFSTPVPIVTDESEGRFIHVYKKALEDGSYAVAAFNFGETEQPVEVELDQQRPVRDVWAKEELGLMEKISITMPPHTVRIFRMR